MHYLTSIAVLLAACGLVRSFGCPPDRIFGFCGLIQENNQGGDGNWYFTALPYTGTVGVYNDCDKTVSSGRACGDESFAKRVYQAASKTAGIPDDGNLKRHCTLTRL
ncbi:hypothetical protein Pst134EA_025703 [Puccinia striiformis f. sp. tritici]|uniref:hypothetical protein n=1 Tax=Puccinia striiformis f. sp. tritici TaxID=168172 RepID=UPI002007D8D6|nr:hypothetical protein Pst134EA_025703 [Puccinia striiformis f. sp. tritici]KAH9451765.1 hypothetical protein Pst134EA_025703 [Puccinia striiformis f. sp. tritici]